MSKVAGPGLQSPIRRISAGCLSDKENSPLGVTRLRTLLKRKVKKAQSTTDSKIKNKTKVPKTDVWVNLKDGTKIKLCSTCATKKKNTASEAQKTKDRIKLSNKSRDNLKDNNIKRTLKTPKIQTISSDSKLLSDNDDKSVVVKKESASKATKPKVTKKTRKDIPKTETPVMNEAKQREKGVVNQNNIKQDTVKTKRTPKIISSTQDDTKSEKKKKVSTRATIKEKNITLNSTNKIKKTSKSEKSDSKLQNTPKSKKTDKNRSKNNTNSEQDQQHMNLAISNNESKSQKKKNTIDDDAEKSEIKNNKKATKVKTKIINEKSTNKLNNSKSKDINSKTLKIRNLSKNNKVDKEKNNQSERFNSETRKSRDSITKNQSDASRFVKRRASVVAKKIKIKDPVKKQVQIQTKERKVPSRSASKTIKIKSNTSNDSKSIINANNSMDDLLANINSHSTMIEDNINDSIPANESKILKINKNLASRASVPVKLEPINDTNEISNYSTSILKNNISFQNNSEKKKLRSSKKVMKPDKLMHITFRDKSMEEKPTSAKQSKINKYEKETEARKKFKNDKKVAKALGEMSKHFSKLHIGKIGELHIGSRFSDVNPILSSSEDSSLYSCDCSCTSSESSSYSSSSHCQCWKCLMEESLNSSSWTESSKYSNDTISSSRTSDSSEFEEITTNNTLSKTYELRNRK